jgi:hypothetical protein
VPFPRRGPTRPRPIRARLGSRLLKPAAGPNPKAATLTDVFATFDAVKWDDSLGASVVTPGWLLLTMPGSVGPAVQVGKLQKYDLASSYFRVRFTTLPSSTGSVLLHAVNSFSPENRLAIGYEGGNLLMREVAAGTVSDTTLAFDSTAHRYVGLSHDGAGNALWQTSPDGVTWTTRRTKTTTVDVAAVQPSIAAQWLGSVGTGNVELEQFNTLDAIRVVTDTTGITDAGQTLTRTANGSDTTGLTDSVSTLKSTQFSATVNDPAGLVDTVTPTLTAGGRTIDDPAGLVDTRAVEVGKVVTDTTGITDAGILQSLAANGVDPAGLTDSISAQLTVPIARTITDSTGITDLGDPLTTDVAETLTDSAGLADATSVSLAGSGSRTANDTAGLIDSLALAATATVTDSAGLTDTVGPNVGRVTTDPAGLTDTAVSQRGIAATVDDTTGVTDLAVSQAAAAASLTDTAGLTDSRAVDQTATTTDTAGLTDSRALAQTATTTDTAGLTDATVAQTAAAGTRQQDDSAGLVDSVALAVTATVNDSGGLTDQAVGAATVPRTQTDTAGLTDATAAELGKAATVTDTAGLTDARAVAVTFTRTVDDSAGTVDTVSAATVGARIVDDPIGLADAAVPAMVVLRTVADTVGLTDLAAAGLASLLNQIITDRAGFSDAVLAENVLQPTVTGEPSVTGDDGYAAVTGDRVPAMVG